MSETAPGQCIGDPPNGETVVSIWSAPDISILRLGRVAPPMTCLGAITSSPWSGWAGWVCFGFSAVAALPR